MAGFDLEWLLKIRTVVARCGEMDVQKWWNTTGQLGPNGARVLRRGFPRTHHFAQARSVFAVAARRSAQVFDPPNSVTLWRLPSSIEDAFEVRWEDWLDDAAGWRPFFEDLARIESPTVEGTLTQFGLVTERDITEAAGLKRSAEGKGVQIAGPFGGTRRDLTLLALAHMKSPSGELAVPYIRWEAA